MVHSVAPEIFTQPYNMICGSGTCGKCCFFGVWVEMDRAVKILSLGDKLASYCRVPRKRWFLNHARWDNQSKSGLWIGTRRDETCCVFFQETGCGIHRYCVENGLSVYSLKPMMCVLFPLSISGTAENGLLEVHRSGYPFPLPCRTGGSTPFRTGKEDLRYYFGNDFVRELEVVEQNLIPGGK